MKDQHLVASRKSSPRGPRGPGTKAVLLGAALLFALGCEEGAERSEVSLEEEWSLRTLVPADSVEIGVVSGEPPYELNGVSDATRLADGTIVIANCMTSELRLFDETGQFIRTIGREGEGPGEFRFPTRIFPGSDDSFAVLDPWLRRVTVFSSDGQVDATINIGGHRGIVGRFSDGSLAVLRRDRPAAALEGREAGAQILTVDLFRLNERGEATDSLMDLPGRRATVGQVGSVDVFQEMPLRLGHAPVVAVFPESIIYGRQDSNGLSEYDKHFRLRRTIPTITTGEVVTEKIRETWEALDDSGTLLPRRSRAGPIMSEVYADTMPAYREILAGRDGWLWVQDPYRLDRYPLTWTAYADGTPVARAELPPRFLPIEFGRDYVLGVTLDDLFVERVQVWRLVPGDLPHRSLGRYEAGVPIQPGLCRPEGLW